MTSSGVGVILFQKSLTEMIKGIRAHRKTEADFVHQCIEEIRQELRSKEVNVKAIAVSKLTYLYMLGHDMDFAAFNVIEVMSETSFTHKRIAYLAATLSFHERLEVLPLVTNLVKKDLLSQNQYEVGMALTCLASMCTPELAHDVVSDVVALLNSQRNYVRKKAVLCLYRVIQQYPGALRPAFPKLFEKLDEGSDKCDPDPVVRCAVVSVLCELARKHPANYLGLAVSFYNLLCSQLNNWTMIKIVKMFGALTPHEPRLGKKIAEPMLNILNTTQAKSLCFEACLTVAISLGKSALPVTRLALEKLRGFVSDADPNLKYLGLLGMQRFLECNPKALVEFREVIVDCLKDADSNIRYRALDLVQGLVSRKSLQGIVGRMCAQLVRNPPDDEWTNLLIRRIVQTCSQDDYSLVTDFEWYMRVLMDLTQTPSTTFEHGELIADQFLELSQRVTELRPFAVKCVVTLLSSTAILTTAMNTERSTHWKILRVACHIAAEYAEHIPNLSHVFTAMVDARLASLPGSFQSVCASSLLKITLYAIHVKGMSLDEIRKILCPEPRTGTRLNDMGHEDGLEMFYHSPDVEAQERALLLQRFVLGGKAATVDASVAELMHEKQAVVLDSISAELRPVAADAQQHVPIPDDLDLDTPLTVSCLEGTDDDDSDASESDESDTEEAPLGRRRDVADYNNHRKLHNTHYLVDDTHPQEEAVASTKDDSPLPPVAKLPVEMADDIDLGVRGMAKSEKKKKPKYSLAANFDAPAGYTGSGKKPSGKTEDMNDLDDDGLNFDPLRPMGKDEVLPTIQPYARPDQKKQEEQEEMEREERRKNKKKKEALAAMQRSRRSTTLVEAKEGGVSVVVKEVGSVVRARTDTETEYLVRVAVSVSNTQPKLALHHVEVTADGVPSCLCVVPAVAKKDSDTEAAEQTPTPTEDRKKVRMPLDGKIAPNETREIAVVYKVTDAEQLFRNLPLGGLVLTVHYKTKEVKHARAKLSFNLPLWAVMTPCTSESMAVAALTRAVQECDEAQAASVVVQMPKIKPAVLAAIAGGPVKERDFPQLTLAFLASELRLGVVEVLDNSAVLVCATPSTNIAVLLRKSTTATASSSGALELVLRTTSQALQNALTETIRVAFSAPQA